MKYIFTILLAVTCSLQVYADSNSATFNQAGFSIDILDAKSSDAGSQRLMMMLPASNGFAANVNVQIQPYPGSLKDYKKFSEAQFTQMGLKTLSILEKESEIYWEYSGNIQGKDLHFYAKVIKVDHLFYLATGTDLESNWPKTSKNIKSVVNSFRAP